MSSSRIPGPLDAIGPWPWFRTPSPLGYNDHGDPTFSARLGDSPGPLGFQDLGDPRLSVLLAGDRLVGGVLGGSQDGVPLALATSQTVPQTAGSIAKEQLKKIFASASDDYLQKVADELNTDLVKYGLDTVLRRSHFFAQVRQEGGAGMDAKIESLQYSPASLKDKFGYYKLHPKEAVTDGYERDARTHKITRGADQETIGNNAYASRNGNGDAASGDGWNFRGRGLIQVTGRSNYAAITTQYTTLYPGSAVDFAKTPALMADFPYTVRSAVCFWILHGLDKLADKGETDDDVDRITAVINLHTDSYADRRANFTVAHDAFK